MSIYLDDGWPLRRRGGQILTAMSRMDVQASPSPTRGLSRAEPACGACTTGNAVAESNDR